MKTSNFAFKITEPEKDAIDYISSKMKITRSKLFYPAFQNELSRSLGFLLIYTIGYRTAADIKELKQILVNERANARMMAPAELGTGHKLPQPITDFLDLITKPAAWKEFKSLFPEVEFPARPDSETLAHLLSLDMNEISHYVGTNYLGNGGQFKHLDLNLCKSILFERLLWEVLINTSQYPHSELNRLWYRHRPRALQFIKKVKKAYEKSYEMEPVEVEEIIEVTNSEKRPQAKEQLPVVHGRRVERSEDRMSSPKEKTRERPKEKPVKKSPKKKKKNKGPRD